MHWYDLGAIAFLAVFAVPVLILLYYIGVIAIHTTRLRRENEAPPAFAETPIGRFSRERGRWNLTGNPAIDISVNNVDGAPDPSFVAQIPQILKELPDYERLAREAYDFDADLADLELDGRIYRLQGLDQCESSDDFILEFNAEEEADEIGTVFITFTDGKVVDTVLVH